MIRSLMLGLCSALAVSMAAPTSAATFLLTASNIDIAQPSPLFTSATVSGTITLSDTVLPGQSFSSNDLLGAHFNFAGIKGSLADIQSDIAPAPIQIFGTRSTDGKSFSVFDFRFGFAPSTPGCSFVCAGQIIINSPIGPNDPSNFIALNDIEGNSLSVINSFTPQFMLSAGVPEPSTWAIMLVGVGAVGGAMRHSRKGRAAISFG